MFDINSLFQGIGSAATKLITLAAGAEQSLFTFGADHPMVGAAVSLAEQELPAAFPQVGEARAIATAVLGLAQTIASATATSANVSSKPLPAAANNTAGEPLPSN